MTPDGGDGGNVVDCSMVAGWTRISRSESGVVTSATIGGGAVTIKASNAPASCRPSQPECAAATIVLSQSGLDGDFQATLTFENFQSADPGGAAGLNFQMPSGAGEILALIRQADVPVLEVLMTGVSPASMPAAATGGTFRVVRNAGLVTVTASAGANWSRSPAPRPPPGRWRRPSVSSTGPTLSSRVKLRSASLIFSSLVGRFCRTRSTATACPDVGYWRSLRELRRVASAIARVEGAVRGGGRLFHRDDRP